MGEECESSHHPSFERSVQLALTYGIEPVRSEILLTVAAQQVWLMGTMGLVDESTKQNKQSKNLQSEA